jgi:TPR repeat protein
MSLIKILFIFVITTAPWAVVADFAQASKHFNSAQYNQSFNQLLMLAQFGHAGAQTLLAESYASGYGTEVDTDSAYAWILMAMENNNEKAQSLYLHYRLKVRSRRKAKVLYKQLQNQFSHQALSVSLFPLSNDPTLPMIELTTTVNQPKNNDNAWAIARYDVDRHGFTSDIQVIIAAPSNVIEDAVVETIKDWQFKPSKLGLHNQIQLFEINQYNQTTFTNSQQHQQLAKLAKAGRGDAQYVYAKLVAFNRVAFADTTALQWLLQSAINGYPPAQYEIYQCLSFNSHCKADSDKAMKWLSMASMNGDLTATMALAHAHLQSDHPTLDHSAKTAAAMLQKLANGNDLTALIDYAKLLVTSDDNEIRNPQQAIKYARQAMALDNNNPELLSTLGIAYYSLGEHDKGQEFLMQAITEAEYRKWSIDDYVNTLEAYQRAVLGVDIQHE